MPITSGMTEIDNLLGGCGFERFSKVLLAGKPGTGKTTFLWQFAAGFLKVPYGLPTATQPRELTTNPRPISRVVQFCSFDEPAVDSLNRFKRDYHDHADLRFLSQCSVHQPKWDSSVSPISGQGDHLILRSGFPEIHANRAKTDPLSLFRSVTDLLDPSSLLGHDTEQILIIDGLNTLLDWVASIFPDAPLNSLVFAVEQSFRMLDKSLDPNVSRRHDAVFFSAEDRSDRPARWTESYLADTVIELARKRISPDPGAERYSEEILVCSVPKGRGLHIQRLEMCYEFSPPSGIKTYASYPALGHVAIFAENSPQRSEIEDFIKHDIPHQYPLLSVSEFDQSNLFKELGFRRAEKDTPRRSPMNLTSIDEYWMPTLTRPNRNVLQPIKLNDIGFYGPQGGTLLPELIDKYERIVGFTGGGVSELNAIPYSLNPSFVVCRAGLGGITEAQIPKSIEGLEDEARRFKGKERTGAIPILIETRTIDSFVSTLLELMTAFGGEWYTVPDQANQNRLSIRFRGLKGEIGVRNAMETLMRWFADGLVPLHSTVDPRHEYLKSGRWLFARHWYSSLIEALTAIGDDGTRLNSIRHRDLRVIYFPGSETANVEAVSTAGEWYFGVLNKTENLSLAHRILSNLLSANKIISRAETGAGLSTCKEFYEEFGSVTCFGTNRTYSWMRGAMRYSISRAGFTNYRHVLHRLYALGKKIMSNAGSVHEKARPGWIEREWEMTKSFLTQEIRE